MRAHPVLTLMLLMACQQVLTFQTRSLWWSDEVRHGAVLRQMLAQGDWVLLRLNDVPYPDKPPIYFWFLGSLARLAGSTDPWVVLLGLGLTVLAVALSVYALARGIGGNRDEGLLAAIIWASSFYLVLVSHYARMDFLFAALIAGGWLAFYRALPDRAPRYWMVLGFFACALATLTKGPFGLLFPVLALVGTLVWQGRLRRLWALDAALGLATFCALLLAWVLTLANAAGWDFLVSIWRGQIIERGFAAEQPSFGYARYALSLPVVFMPWAMLPLVAGGWRRLAPASLRRFWQERHAAPGASVFLWAATLGGFAVLTLVREKHEYYLLPLMVPMAILTARGYLAASPNVRRRFHAAIAICLALVAAVPILAERLGNLPYPVAGLPLAGAILAAAAGFVWRVRDRAAPALAGLVVGQTLWINAIGLVTLPSLDPALSPAGVARALAARSEPDAPLAAFALIAGTLRYDLGRPYLDFGRRDRFLSWLDQQKVAVFATTRPAFDYHLGMRNDLTVVDEVPLAGDSIVIVRKGPAPGF